MKERNRGQSHMLGTIGYTTTADAFAHAKTNMADQVVQRSSIADEMTARTISILAPPARHKIRV